MGDSTQASYDSYKDVAAFKLKIININKNVPTLVT